MFGNIFGGGRRDYSPPIGSPLRREHTPPEESSQESSQGSDTPDSDSSSDSINVLVPRRWRDGPPQDGYYMTGAKGAPSQASLATAASYYTAKSHQSEESEPEPNNPPAYTVSMSGADERREPSWRYVATSSGLVKKKMHTGHSPTASSSLSGSSAPVPGRSWGNTSSSGSTVAAPGHRADQQAMSRRKLTRAEQLAM